MKGRGNPETGLSYSSLSEELIDQILCPNLVGHVLLQTTYKNNQLSLQQRTRRTVITEQLSRNEETR